MSISGKHYFDISPASPARTRLEEAEEYFLAQNFNEALAAAQQAWREYPREADVFRILAYIHMTRGEYQPAAQAAYQSVLIEGNNPASFSILAQVYLTFNMFQLAEETLQKAREHFPQDTSLLLLHADVLFRRNNPKLAEQFAWQALQQSPNDAYARSLLGSYYLKKRRYREAAPQLQAAVNAYPQRWDYMRDLGISLLRTGHPHEAREMLEKSFRLNTHDISTAHNLYLAFRQDNARQGWYWVVVRFCYDYIVFGWLLEIFGIVLFILSLGVLFSVTHILSNTLLKGVLYLLSGVISIILGHPALQLRFKKGHNFLRYLWKAIGGTRVQLKASDEA